MNFDRSVTGPLPPRLLIPSEEDPCFVESNLPYSFDAVLLESILLNSLVMPPIECGIFIESILFMSRFAAREPDFIDPYFAESKRLS